MEEVKDWKSSEEEFLEQYRPEEYERPSVTTDVLVFTIENVQRPILKVLLIKRNDHPFMNSLALPGGFVGINESIDDAARRKLKEKTGVENTYLEQLYTFGEPERDPRMRIMTVVYLALLPEGSSKPNGKECMEGVDWFQVEIKIEKDIKQLIISGQDANVRIKYNIRETMVSNGVIGKIVSDVWLDDESKSRLAFDHAEIIYMGISRIAGKCEYSPLLFNLMPSVFTIPQLQSVYELFLKKKLHKTRFREKIASFINETSEVDKSTFRPAKTYQYKERQ